MTMCVKGSGTKQQISMKSERQCLAIRIPEVLEHLYLQLPDVLFLNYLVFKSHRSKITYV